MSFVQTSIPEERFYQNNVFPLTLSWQDSSAIESQSITEWLIENREKVDSYLRTHKAILFRSSNYISSHEDFHNFVEAINYETMDYVGGAAVRTQLTNRVFTANESPSSETIPFHHEMAQTPHPPTHLFFFCETAPTNGGATPILVSAEVCEKLDHSHPDFMKSLENRGVNYVRYMPEFDDPTSAIGRGWRSTFLTENKQGAEDALRALGSTWEWQEHGILKTITATIPAIRYDDTPATATRSQQKTFFNSVVAAYTGWNDSRNDGSRAVILGTDREGQAENERLLDERAIADAATIMGEISVAFSWQPGDVLLLDNRTAMHSRQSFDGPRRILASLGRDPMR